MINYEIDDDGTLFVYYNNTILFEGQDFANSDEEMIDDFIFGTIAENYPKLFEKIKSEYSDIEKYNVERSIK